MPNWEESYVVILGPEERIDALISSGFVREATEQEKADAYGPLTHIVDFGAVVPEPENIERGLCPRTGSGGLMSGGLDPATGEVCWYEFHRRAWGTKWNASNADLMDRVTPERLNMHFQTAWSQPTPVLKAIEQKFGVQVFCLTIDEGGFPDVIYGEDEIWDLLSTRREVAFSDYTPEVWGQYPSDN